jgi:hypothetical protein
VNTLGVIDVEVATRAGYESLIRTHILPLLGSLPVGRVRGASRNTSSNMLTSRWRSIGP